MVELGGVADAEGDYYGDEDEVCEAVDVGVSGGWKIGGGRFGEELGEGGVE